MNSIIASSSPLDNHLYAFLSGILSGLLFLNLRTYAWLPATPLLKKIACLPDFSLSVLTVTFTGRPYSRFLGSPNTGTTRYVYS